MGGRVVGRVGRGRDRGLGGGVDRRGDRRVGCRPDGGVHGGTRRRFPGIIGDEAGQPVALGGLLQVLARAPSFEGL
jgi:hypothetical protein